MSRRSRDEMKWNVRRHEHHTSIRRPLQCEATWRSSIVDIISPQLILCSLIELFAVLHERRHSPAGQEHSRAKATKVCRQGMASCMHLLCKCVAARSCTTGVAVKDIQINKQTKDGTLAAACHTSSKGDTVKQLVWSWSCGIAYF